MALGEIQEYSRKRQAEIDKHKWLMSEVAGRDLGKKAVEDWVQCHEDDFRRYWLENRFFLD